MVATSSTVTSAPMILYNLDSGEIIWRLGHTALAGTLSAPYIARPEEMAFLPQPPATADDAYRTLISS